MKLLGLLKLKPFNRQTWLSILLTAALIAVGMALWPTARCAADGDCGARDKWCLWDCTVGCAGGSGVEMVYGCSRNGGACYDLWKEVGTICAAGSNCNVTSTHGGGRLYQFGGYSYWYVGSCDWSTCSLQAQTNSARVDCCGASGGPGDPNPEPPCEPDYDAPRIDINNKTMIPAYPLVLGQDPDRMGIAIAGINIYGGTENACDLPTATITSVETSISLSSASVEWIEGYLASRYYGAHVLGSYPMSPDETVMAGLGTPFVTLGFHFENPDPGNYEIEISVTQSDGQTAKLIIPVESYLLDVTLTSP